MKKSFALTFSVLAALAAQADVGPITITPHTFSQNPDTQDVTVHYDLSNSGNPAWVCMDVLTDGVSIGTSNLKTFSGDISTMKMNFVEEGVNRTIVWKARTDWPHHVSTNAVIRLFAYYTNHLASVPGIYMVVDLSGGTNATSYPISYTLTPPNPLTDTTCASNHLWLKRVEAGNFMMGSADTEAGHTDKETQHKVTLTNAFFIGVFPVTVAQYQLVTGLTPSDSTRTSSALCPVNVISYDDIRGVKTNTADNIDWPTTKYNVSSNTFFGVLRSKTDVSLRFDLPTEAEWECACRAGTTSAWNDGSNFETNAAGDDASLDKLGWYGKNSGLKTNPVGQQAPNAWGLYDCHGNVSEWCLDWTKGESLGTEAAIEPVGMPSGYYRVVRGGNWGDSAQCCRSASRTWNKTYNKASFIGFRIAFVVGQE